MRGTPVTKMRVGENQINVCARGAALRFLTTRIHSAHRAPAELSFNVSDAAVSVNTNGESGMERSDRLRLSR